MLTSYPKKIQDTTPKNLSPKGYYPEKSRPDKKIYPFGVQAFLYPPLPFYPLRKERLYPEGVNLVSFRTDTTPNLLPGDFSYLFKAFFSYLFCSPCRQETTDKKPLPKRLVPDTTPNLLPDSVKSLSVKKYVVLKNLPESFSVKEKTCTPKGYYP